MNDMLTNAERVPAHGGRWRDVCLARISMASGRPDQTSTKTQAEEMAAFSATHNGDVVRMFVESGKSAYKENVRRPDLESAIRMIQRGEADRLVVWKLDRWIRNVRELARLIDRVERAGGTFVSKCEPWCDTSSPIGYALVILVGALAEVESKNRADRALPWHNDRIKDGKTPGGPRPYGYKRERNKLTIIPAEAKTIREAASRVIAGETLRSIAMDFNTRGIATGKAGSSWTHTLVKRVVTNPTTAGMRAHAMFGTESEKGFGKGSWTAILDEATWTQVRGILLNPTRRISHTNTLAHFLSGAMTCGKDACGGTMRHTPHSKGPRYRCATCGHSIGAAETEAYVTECLLSLVDEDAWSTMRARGRMTDRHVMDRLNAKLDAARERWMNDDIDDDEWFATQASFKARMESLKDSDAVELPEWDSLPAGWAGGDAADKRTVITTVFESITVNPRAVGCNGTERIKCVVSPSMASGVIAA